MTPEILAEKWRREIEDAANEGFTVADIPCDSTLKPRLVRRRPWFVYAWWGFRSRWDAVIIALRYGMDAFE